MTQSSDVLDASAIEQAQMIRAGDISSEELTRLYLARIERFNPRITAFVDVFNRSALRDARQKDRERSRIDVLPPFHGVPIGIKDLNLVRGAFARLGSRSFRYLWSPIDDRSASQLRRGGFVFLGKLATSELGTMPVTEPDIHEPTRNPWDLGRTAGGSSGGSGAAMAAGLIPIAHGSDGAGSIRIPASFCDLYGLKPSRGLLPNAYGFRDKQIIYTCGPIARTVDDAAAMLDVMAGISVPRSRSERRDVVPFAQRLRGRQGPLRIRLATSTPLGDTDPEIAAMVRSAAKVLESLGHHIEESTMPEGSLDEFLPIWQLLTAGALRVNHSLAQPITQWLAMAGKNIRHEDVSDLVRRLKDRYLAWFGDVDVCVTPTVGQFAPAIGAFRSLPPAQAFERAAPLGFFTAQFNLTGQPAASIPIGLSRAGLPIGLQIAARTDRDDVVLAVSRQFEEAMPWRHRRAPLDGES